MTWLKAPEINWQKLDKKGRKIALVDFINDNPVLNQQNIAAERYLGGASEVRHLWDKIYENCESLLQRFSKPNSAINSKELQLSLMRFITEEIIKQHVHQMLNDDSYENSERNDFRPGCIYYPAHFYVAKFDFFDDTIEFFDAKYKSSIYAEFYNEFDDYEDKAKINGEAVKRRRPVLLVNDERFVKVEAIPCSSNPGKPEIKLKLPGVIRYSFAVIRFLFTITPAMLKNGESKESVGKVHRDELNQVVKYLPRRRW